VEEVVGVMPTDVGVMPTASTMAIVAVISMMSVALATEIVVVTEVLDAGVMTSVLDMETVALITICYVPLKTKECHT